MLVLVVPPATAAAQDLLPVGGTILRLTPADTVPLAGVHVVLHRVGRDFQGPVDSTLSRADGSFRFDFGADTAADHAVGGEAVRAEQDAENAEEAEDVMVV